MMCNLCGADKGEYCGLNTSHVYRGGTCPKQPKGGPIYLTHGAPIRAASWSDTTFASVFTVAGYAMDAYVTDDTIDDSFQSMLNTMKAAVEQAKANQHDLVGSVYTGGVLKSIGNKTARRLKERRTIAATATVLKTGDIVSVDGERYVVRFAPGNEFGKAPRNSNPIKFVPIEE